MSAAKSDQEQEELPLPNEVGFSEAVNELEEILRRIESEEIDLDRLAAELKRATVLLELCRGKVRRAEIEVRQIVDAIGDGGDGGDGDDGVDGDGDPSAAKTA